MLWSTTPDRNREGRIRASRDHETGLLFFNGLLPSPIVYTSFTFYYALFNQLIHVYTSKRPFMFLVAAKVAGRDRTIQ